MLEANMFEIDGQTYRTCTISARAQFHIVRRLSPVLGKVAPMVQDITAMDSAGGDPVEIGMKALPAMADAIANLSDADADYILLGLLRAVSKKQPNGIGWSPIVVGDNIMFDDMTMPQMLQIAWQTFNHNMSGFFSALPSDLKGAALNASNPSNG